MPIDHEIIATVERDGRRYEVFRVGLGTDPAEASWHLYGIRPFHTDAELKLMATKRPYLPYVYASPVQRMHLHIGNPDAPIKEGWEIRDEMNRETLGYATTLDEVATVGAKALGALIT